MIIILCAGAIAYAAAAVASYRLFVRWVWQDSRRSAPSRYNDTSYPTRDEPHLDDQVFGAVIATFWPLGHLALAIGRLTRNQRFQEAAEQRRRDRLAGNTHSHRAAHTASDESADWS